MANYNTFQLFDTKSRKTIIITSSARKCKQEFEKGMRIDVWNENVLTEVIYARNLADIDKYIRMEKEYIARKQAAATERNQRRKKLLQMA